MAELKTKKHAGDPIEFINTIENEVRKKDALTMLKMMETISECKPEMWGDSIIGYGSKSYAYTSGRTGEWMKIGFSPRKTALTLYVIGDYDQSAKLLEKLGKHKLGKSCLYIKKLDDVNLGVLAELIGISFNSSMNVC
jgi:hypothetical protein